MRKLGDTEHIGALRAKLATLRATIAEKHPERGVGTTQAPVCGACGGAGWVRVAEIASAPGSQSQIAVCVCQRKRLAREAWERALAASDFADELRTLDFAGYDPTYNPLALQATQAWTAALCAQPDGSEGGAADMERDSETRPWLLLYGGYGTGKTRLLAAAFNALLAAGRYPLYIVVPPFLDYVRDGLNAEKNGRDTGAYSARSRAVREAPLLILDDLGAEKRSDWTDEALFKLLDYRYRAALPTAVATNVLLGDLEGRIASRLRDHARAVAIPMSGPDYRLTPHQSTARSVQKHQRNQKDQRKETTYP